MLLKRLSSMLASFFAKGASHPTYEHRLVRKAPVTRASEPLVERMRANDRERNLGVAAQERIQKAEEKRKRKQEKLKKLSQK